MTLDCKLHRKMKQSRVISCGESPLTMRTVAFILSLLPFLARYRLPVGGKGFLFCVTAQDNSHGGLYFIVTAFPCPVSVPGWRKGLFILRDRAGQFARWPFSICYCPAPPGSLPGAWKGYLFCPAYIFMLPLHASLLPLP